ncbi:MAG: sigma-54-dependent Fis family transcriptional regulator [Desulfobacterales bacterium]|nr:sigma-54-dependent Fis family transcriptional regulator [Desulfobacterales bacterium]
MIEYTIYVIDDEKTIRSGIAFGLGKQYRVEAFPTAEEGVEAIKRKKPDLVLLDIGLPGMSGVEALEVIKKIDHEIVVVMITAYEDVKTVIAAMKLGAYDYIIKPLEMGVLKVCIQNALDAIRLKKEIQALQEKYIRENIPCFVGESNAIQNVMKFVGKVAGSPDTPILILGESGSGKELIARAIHYKSPNFNGPLVAINCAAIAKDLMESEMFGYEKGAFTGAATSGKKGLIEEAANGTLFLDEVGDLSKEAQGKLLRFLQNGEYYRVGGTKKRVVRTRIVSATNQDLNALIDEGRFRLDLFYRLAVIQVEIPSLNERRGDIIPIAKSFLVEFAKKHGKRFNRVSEPVEAFLENHHWKGNIRELRNLIERGVLVGDGPELLLSDIGQSDAPEGEGSSPSLARGVFPPLPDEGVSLEEMEAHYIREALEKTGGNETRAARLLRMNYYAFRYQKKKLLKS